MDNEPKSSHSPSKSPTSGSPIPSPRSPALSQQPTPAQPVEHISLPQPSLEPADRSPPELAPGATSVPQTISASGSTGRSPQGPIELPPPTRAPRLNLRSGEVRSHYGREDLMFGTASSFGESLTARLRGDTNARRRQPRFQLDLVHIADDDPELLRLRIPLMGGLGRGKRPPPTPPQPAAQGNQPGVTAAEGSTSSSGSSNVSYHSALAEQVADHQPSYPGGSSSSSGSSWASTGGSGFTPPPPLRSQAPPQTPPRPPPQPSPHPPHHLPLPMWEEREVAREEYIRNLLDRQGELVEEMNAVHANNVQVHNLNNSFVQSYRQDRVSFEG